MEPFVKHHIEGNCGIIEFGNLSGNSLTSNMLNGLCQNLTSLDFNKQVKVILLKSAGLKAFSGGASFTELKTLKSFNEARGFFMGFANLINAIRILKKFVIIQIQGKVVGGGIGIVAACDYTIAHEKAEIKLSELSIGLGPFVIEPAITRKIGSAAFAQLSLEAENWKTAKWARKKGLYNSVVSSHEELEKSARELAKKFGNYSSDAMEKLRKLHWKNTEDWKDILKSNAEITAKLLFTETAQTILEKF